MTKKDYELIARVLRADAYLVAARRHSLANAFADELARENPAFDRARFLKACGV